MGLIKTHIDRTFQINNNWQGFQSDFRKLTSTKKQFCTVSNKQNQKIYLSKTNEPSVTSSHRNETTTNRTYSKLRYIGAYSSITQKNLRNIIGRYCNNNDIKLVFSAFKINKLFSNKDKIPNSLKSHASYLFT